MNTRMAYGMIGIGFLILFVGVWFFSNPKAIDTNGSQVSPNLTGILTIAGQAVDVEVVSTEEKMSKGLSGRTALLPNTGMLFAFPTPGQYSFWMPDMKFSIDIIWFDENWKVIYIKENATPESYPENFTPTSPALFVLEVPTGFVYKHAITVGTSAHFERDQ